MFFITCATISLSQANVSPTYASPCIHTIDLLNGWAPAGGETYRERQRSAKLAESFGYLFYSCVGDYHTGFTAAGKH